MSNDRPYTKREIDMLFQGLHDKLDDFMKKTEKLYVTTSDNSGGIEQLWQQNAELKSMIADNADASKLIKEINTTWKVGKAVVSFVIGILIFIVSLKAIFQGNMKEGLLQIKNLIF